MIHVFLICLACCCSSLMPLKQSESILSEDHTQVIERKSKNNMFVSYGNCYTASDFLSYDFGQYFYDYISEFDSPRTNNLTYTHSGAKSIEYEFRSEDGPIGQLTMGGYSNNLFAYTDLAVGSVNNYVVTLPNSEVVRNIFNTNIIFSEGSYTLSASSFTRTGNSRLVVWFDDNTNHVLTSLPYTSPSDKTIASIGFDFGNQGSLIIDKPMLVKGSSVLPFEPYFTGAVQFGGVTATIMKISVESVFNSQYNTYGYQYFLGFYARIPNEDRLVLGVHSMIIPNLKWLDSQDNLYNAGLFVYSSIELNPSLSQYNLHNFVWREQSEYTRKPITTYYFNKRALALSNDESNALYNEGYDTGYNNGNTAGYQRGYSEGVSYAQEQSSTALTIFTGIIEVGLLPVNVFLKMFEYEVFGINIAGLVSGLITIAMIMILLRFIFGGKQNGK